MGKRGPQPGAVYAPTIEKAKQREVIREIVTEHLRPMLDAQIANAKGIKYLVARSRSGKFERISEEELKAILAGDDNERVVIEVWDKDPSTHAFADLCNRAFDKPAEHVQVTGEDGGPLVVKWQD